MASRPIFIATNDTNEFVKEINIDFTFFNGFAITQKAKSIQSLHENALKNGYKNVLEVSSKSNNKLGWRLSAFNLMVHFEKNKKISLECAFQGSKVFEGGIQYKDIYNYESIEAKKDERLKKSGGIIGFSFNGEFWENEPKTAFYDYLYMTTIYSNYKNILEELIEYDAFTDIEFNPKKSLNCQARTCAILVSLTRKGILDNVLKSKENFIKTIYNRKYNHQASLF